MADALNKSGKLFNKVDGKNLAAGSSKLRKMLVLASVVTVILNFLPDPYNYIVIYPIRLFVTFIHELGHAMAATITGGQVKYLQVFANGEGVTWGSTPLWAQWLFLSGGYMGTTLFGAGLLQFVKFTGWKIQLGLLGAYILLVTLLWAHNPIDNLFTLLVGVALAGLLFASAKYLSEEHAGFLVMFLAVQCCLNAINDLRILLYLTTRTNRDNDAVFMSRQYLMPPTFWAGLWAICSLAILCLALWLFLRSSFGKRQKAINPHPG